MCYAVHLMSIHRGHSEGGERWSARKVFRRYLEHEREYMGQIRQVLARVKPAPAGGRR